MMTRCRKGKEKRRLAGILFLAALSWGSFSGCVDQSGGGEKEASGQASVRTLLEITDPQEKAAVEAAGLTVLEVHHQGEWVSVTARKETKA